MYVADYHTHSSCSPDAFDPMTAMAEGALTAGVSELCLTDHWDLLTLEGERMGHYDWAPALAQFHEMQAQYGDRLTLRLGVEFGMGHIDAAVADALMREEELDFVLGAVHNLSVAAGGRDFYTLSYERAADCYAALDNYFVSLEEMSRSGCFDVLAHVIYPLRYMQGNYETPISLARYEDTMRGIFRILIEQGKGIEINTWRGRSIEEWRPVLQMYRALGGEIITVGSDAHSPNMVGKGVAESYGLLRELGYRYLSVYEKRKVSFLPLP